MAEKRSSASAAPPVGITLPERLDLTFCTEQAPEILRLRGSPVRFCAARVTFLGAPGLQLLLSVARQWHQDGHRCEVTGASEAFCDGAALLGYRRLPFAQGGAA